MEYAHDPVWELLPVLLEQPAAKQSCFQNAVAAAAGDVLVEAPLQLLNYVMKLPAAEARALHMMMIKVVNSYVSAINLLLDESSTVISKDCTCTLERPSQQMLPQPPQKKVMSPHTTVDPLGKSWMLSAALIGTVACFSNLLLIKWIVPIVGPTDPPGSHASSGPVNMSQ